MNERLELVGKSVFQRLKLLGSPITVLGVVALAAGAIRWLIYRQYDTPVQALLAMGLALIGLFIVTRPEEVKLAIAGRTARYGSNALLMSVAFLGILILINMLAGRHHYRLDLTANKEHTLAPQTVQILKGLAEPVKILGFFAPGDPGQQDTKDLLDEYRFHSDKISYEFVDPERQPSLARQYGVTSYGTLVFIRGDKRQSTFATDEQSITSTILKVSRDTQKTIYFVTGHKERDPSGYDEIGYGQVARMLETNNYVVTTLNLAAISTTITATIPTSSVIVLASPQTPLLDRETEALTGWIEAGGKALIMADPAQPVPLSGYLAQLGLAFRDDVVIDPGSSFFGDPATPMATDYPFSQITRDLGGLATFFPVVRDIERKSPPENISITPLVKTSANSWGETDYKSQQVRFDPDKDAKGPLELAVTVEDSKTKARLLLVGDSDFAANNSLTIGGQVGNADLFLNMVNWLAEEEELISITPKPPVERTVILTAPQERTIFYSSIVFLPLAVLGAGVFVWWRRR
jgi:ABC-type uncharacterized transport system involved in gliding motility auxiliary subunit